MRVTVKRGGEGRRKAGKKGVGGDGALEMEPAQTGDDAGAGAASFRRWERAYLTPHPTPTPQDHHPTASLPAHSGGSSWQSRAESPSQRSAEGSGPPTHTHTPPALLRQPPGRLRKNPAPEEGITAFCRPEEKGARRGVGDASTAEQWAGPVTATSREAFGGTGSRQEKGVPRSDGVPGQQGRAGVGE